MSETTLVRDGYAFETVTVSTSAIGVTAALLSPTSGQPPQRALITIATNAIRYRYDGVSPTSTVGHYVVAGGSITVEGWQNIRNLKMIQDTGAGGSGIASVTLER